jgi:hypothetical protein
MNAQQKRIFQREGLILDLYNEYEKLRDNNSGMKVFEILTTLILKNMHMGLGRYIGEESTPTERFLFKIVIPKISEFSVNEKEEKFMMIEFFFYLIDQIKIEIVDDLTNDELSHPELYFGTYDLVREMDPGYDS